MGIDDEQAATDRGTEGGQEGGGDGEKADINRRGRVMRLSRVSTQPVVGKSTLYHDP